MDHPLALAAAGFILATMVALVARWVRAKARRAERRCPPGGRFLEADGVRLHYLEKGAGPPVLLLHGNGAQASDFVGCGLMDRLAGRYRVIAFDRPGYGYSERPRDRLWTPREQARLLAVACAQLGAARPIVIGHSWGTLVALAMAVHGAMPLRGLVLLSGYYFPSLRLDAMLLAVPAIPVIGDLLRYTLSPLLGWLLMPQILGRIFAPQEVPRSFIYRVPPPLIVRPWQLRASAEESGLMVPCAANLARRYHQLREPIAIFAGSADRIVRQFKQSVRFHRQVPHSELHFFPDEGHMLHYSLCDKIAMAVDRIAVAAHQPVGRVPAARGSRPPRPGTPAPI